MPQAPQVSTHFGGVVQHALGRYRIAHHHGLAGTHDAGFFKTDAFAVLAQQLGVVNVDAGD